GVTLTQGAATRRPWVPPSTGLLASLPPEGEAAHRNSEFNELLRQRQAGDMRHQNSIHTAPRGFSGARPGGSDLRWRIEIASGIHQDGRGKDEAKDRRYK